MSTHLHALGVIMGFKTGLTMCGKRVRKEHLAAPDTDADCEVCREKARADFAATCQLVEHIAARGLDTADIQSLVASGVSYRNAYLWR